MEGRREGGGWGEKKEEEKGGGGGGERRAEQWERNGDHYGVEGNDGILRHGGRGTRRRRGGREGGRGGAGRDAPWDAEGPLDRVTWGGPPIVASPQLDPAQREGNPCVAVAAGRLVGRHRRDGEGRVFRRGFETCLKCLPEVAPLHRGRHGHGALRRHAHQPHHPQGLHGLLHLARDLSVRHLVAIGEISILPRPRGRAVARRHPRRRYHNGWVDSHQRVDYAAQGLVLLRGSLG